MRGGRGQEQQNGIDIGEINYVLKTGEVRQMDITIVKGGRDKHCYTEGIGRKDTMERVEDEDEHHCGMVESRWERRITLYREAKEITLWLQKAKKMSNTMKKAGVGKE